MEILTGNKIVVWKALLGKAMGPDYTFIAAKGKVGKVAEEAGKERAASRRSPDIDFGTLRGTHKFRIMAVQVNGQGEEGQVTILRKAYDFAAEKIAEFGYEKLNEMIENGEFELFASYEAEQLRQELQEGTVRGTVRFVGDTPSFVDEGESSDEEGTVGTVVQRDVEEKPSVEEVFGGTVVVRDPESRPAPEFTQAPKVEKAGWFKSLFGYVFSKFWNFITFRWR